MVSHGMCEHLISFSIKAFGIINTSMILLSAYTYLGNNKTDNAEVCIILSDGLSVYKID